MDNFTWPDNLPYNYVRITKLFTGTYNEDLDYIVKYKTNKSEDYKEYGTYNTQKNNYIDFTEVTMNQYTYFVLGILLGLGIAIYFFMTREEKIEKRIMLDQKIYSTEKLDTTMKTVVEKITSKINELKRELTEEEKNERIEQCYKKFYV